MEYITSAKAAEKLGITRRMVNMMCQRGEIKGEIKGERKTLYSLVRDGLLDISIASERANMTLEEFKKGLNAAYPE